MAFPTPVNSRITDAVTQQNVTVLGSAPAVAMGSVYQSASHSIAIAFENAVQAQRQSAICAQAATNMGVMQVYSIGAMSTAVATTRAAQTDTASKALMLALALDALRRR